MSVRVGCSAKSGRTRLRVGLEEPDGLNAPIDDLVDSYSGEVSLRKAGDVFVVNDDVPRDDTVHKTCMEVWQVESVLGLMLTERLLA